VVTGKFNILLFCVKAFPICFYVIYRDDCY
jgi:hypothetical protein